MEFLRLNREKLDETISFLNENLIAKIFIIQKIKLISMFHDLLDTYNKELVFVSSSIDEIKIRVEGKNILAPIPPNIRQTIDMYNGKIEIDGTILVITVKTSNKKNSNY